MFILVGKTDHCCNPKERGGEARGKEKKRNGQTGICPNALFNECHRNTVIHEDLASYNIKKHTSTRTEALTYIFFLCYFFKAELWLKVFAWTQFIVDY